MRQHMIRKVYDPIVHMGKGIYIGSLQNPVSPQPISQKKGSPYRGVFVVNPMRGGEMNRILVSEEDMKKIKELREIVITSEGKVIGRRQGGSIPSLEYCIFGEQVRHIEHMDGNLMDFRRENIRKINPNNGQCAVKHLTETKGYWNMSFEGSTRALISLCIYDDPAQSWEKLVKRVSEIKGRPLEETDACLKEFERRGMLGYHEDAVWKEYKNVCIN